MADKKNKKKIKVSFQLWFARSKKIIKILLVVISSRIIRWLFITFLFAASVWLLYVNMWLLLNQEKGLPPGISPHNPQVQEDILRELHVERATRVQQPIRSFMHTRNYFRF